MNKKKRTAPAWSMLLLTGLFFLGGCGDLLEYDLTKAGAGAEDRISADEEAISGSGGEEGLTEEDPVTSVPPEEETIWIDVVGAVVRPGVYELPPESRVFAAIQLAGGLTEEAEPRSLNQAAPLQDGQQIIVLTKEEAEAQAEQLGGSSSGGSGKINLNTATKEQLMTLSGIGEARATAILQYRETHGPFAAIEEIMNIEGIKEKGFEKIKEEIEV